MADFLPFKQCALRGFTEKRLRNWRAAGLLPRAPRVHNGRPGYYEKDIENAELGYAVGFGNIDQTRPGRVSLVDIAAAARAAGWSVG